MQNAPQKSRQEQGFNKFKETFFKLIDTHKEISPENRKATKAAFTDMFEDPLVGELMLQSFADFMWSNDNKVQQDVANELLTVQKMIPKIADSNDQNTIKIGNFLQTLIDEAAEKVEYVDGADLVAEFDGELGEDDNEPIPGVK